jgi:hypothetical protein
MDDGEMSRANTVRVETNFKNVRRVFNTEVMKQVYVQSDVTHVPFLFVRHPDWHAYYDQDGVMAEATRRKVYDMLAAEKMRVQGFHYPFPSLAQWRRTVTAIATFRCRGARRSDRKAF